MSYTNETLVRQYLVEARPANTSVSDQAVVFPSDDYTAFYTGPVDADSLRVKSSRGGSIHRLSLTLASGGTVVSTSPLVPGSVVVAADSSLGTVYAENADYVVDYGAGTLHVKDGGALDAGDAVVVWYRACHVYARDLDYSLRADSGEIRRVPSGAIGPHETVLLDYVPVYAGQSELVLHAAVLEANATVQRAVDPDGAFGADPLLQAAATYAALGIVCRASALHSLTGGSAPARSADSWLELADRFDSRSLSLLSSFRPPATGPSAPART